MSTLVTIKGRVRRTEECGKNVCKRLRRAGELPGNLISKTESTAIALHPKFLSVAWQNGRKFTFECEGKSSQVFIKELQIDPIKRTPIHVDLIPA